MLNLYTDQSKIPDNLQVILDVEGEFFKHIYNSKLENRFFTDETSNLILKQIEGMQSRIGSGLVNHFGEVLLKEISTGSKAALLSVAYSNYCISNLEMGRNIMCTLLDLSNTHEINILAYNPILLFHSDMTVTLDGVKMQFNQANDIIFNKMESENKV